jgi:hypothetical protein
VKQPRTRVSASGLFGGASTRHYHSFGAAFRRHWLMFALVPAVFGGTILLRHSKWIWAPLAALFLAATFAVWMKSFSAARALAATPRAKVASAAQGYAELAGEALPLGSPLQSPYSAVPCLWYRYIVETKDGDGDWRASDSGASREAFVLRDETGDCVIEPDGFEVVSFRVESWDDGGERRTEHLIMGGDPIYAIGDFRTEGERHALRPASGRTSVVSNFTEAELRRKGMIASLIALALFVGFAAFFGWLALRTLRGP